MNVNLNLMKENVIQISGGISNKYRCECKKYYICGKYYNWNPSTCICENGKY